MKKAILLLIIVLGLVFTFACGEKDEKTPTPEVPTVEEPTPDEPVEPTPDVPVEPTPEVKKYNVTFIIDCAMEMQEVVEGECATKIADPTIKGFVFEGWYADSEYTTVYDFSKPVTSNINIYAKFSPEGDLTPYEQLEKAAEGIVLPEVIRDDIELPTKVGGFTAEWTSNNRSLTKEGKYTYVDKEVDVKLSVTLIYGEEEEFYDKEFNVKIGPYVDSKCVELVAESFEFSKELSSNSVLLPTEFKYGVTGKWTSKDNAIDVTTGEIYEVSADTIARLEVVFSKGDATVSKTVTVIIHPYKGIVATEHNIKDYAKNFKGTFDNVELNEKGKLVLVNGATVGTYTSVEIDTKPFEEVVATWNCITSTTCTAELKVSVCVNGTWSKYFTYGEWGLGKENYYYNQTDTNVKMSVDEIMVLNGKTANKIKYQVVLKRDTKGANSPELSLVTFALYMSGYSYKVDTTGLPTSVDWDVPKLYQHDVRVIGSVICSATTTTMLLKYKGHDFKDEAKTYKNVSSWGAYEHGYIASLVADPGHNSPTYGNWTYNMVTAGAFGETAYVARMYSWDELKYHLATYGPCGVSIAGNFGIYTTGGHLLVARGYREDSKGTTVICNDPNVNGVYYEVSLSIFMNAWRGVSYIVE